MVPALVLEVKVLSVVPTMSVRVGAPPVPVANVTAEVSVIGTEIVIVSPTVYGPVLVKLIVPTLGGVVSIAGGVVSTACDAPPFTAVKVVTRSRSTASRIVVPLGNVKLLALTETPSASVSPACTV